MFKLSQNLLVRPKVFWPSLIVLLILSISFFALKEKEKRARIDTQRRLTNTIAEKRVVEHKLEETTITKNTLQKELGLEKERVITLGKELNAKKRQIRLTLEKLEKEATARREAETHLIIALKEKRALETKAMELAKATKTIELEKIVVKITPPLVGRVVTVNREYDFIVADLGREDNIKLGEILSVYRNDEFIGSAQVERVEESICAAAILPAWHDVEFNENDTVRLI